MKAKNETQLQAELLIRLNAAKPAFLRMFQEDVLGIESVVGNADLAGNMLPGGPRYKMYGGGCSVSWMVGKGIKGKKFANAATRAIYEFKDAIQPELKRLYPDKPIGPLMAQDITVNEFLQHEASKWFDENGVTVKCITKPD